jgi:thiamine biosynthesis protein ThiC
MEAAGCAWAVKAAADKVTALSTQARVRGKREFFIGNLLKVCQIGFMPVHADAIVKLATGGRSSDFPHEKPVF